MEDLSGWYWFIGICFVGAVVFFFWWLASATTSQDDSNRFDNRDTALTRRNPSTSLNSSEALMIPDKWDEKEINQGLQLYRRQPDALTHYVQSVIQRLVTGQDTKTIRRRTEFLKAQVERLQIGHEYMTLVRSLQRLQVEEDTKDIQANMAREEAERERVSRADLHEREQEFKRKQLDKKIAKAEKKIKEAREQSQKQSKSSPGEERAQQRAHWQKEVERLKREKEKAAADAEDEDEKIELENMYDDAIRNAREQLRKYL